MTVRLTYDDLDRLQATLFQRWLDGLIDVMTYVREWDDVVALSGWGWDELCVEIDRRWTMQTMSIRSADMC